MSELEIKDRNGGVGVAVTGTLSADLDGNQVAQAFWGLGDEGQAKFFNKLGVCSAGRMAMQLEYVRQNKELNAHGRRVMELIGEYAKK